MPFLSEKQRKLCYHLRSKGEAGSWNCDEWEEETKDKKLPKYVNKGENEKSSNDEKKYRDRVEVFGLNPKGRVYGGVWDQDKSFAIPGGGIDPGEDVLSAAAREYLEETGLPITNMRLAGVNPTINEWSEEYRKSLPPDRKDFYGTRTHYVLGDLQRRLRKSEGPLDHWGASQRGLYSPNKALSLMEGKVPLSPEAYEARKIILQSLLKNEDMNNKQEKRAAAKEVFLTTLVKELHKQGVDISQLDNNLHVKYAEGWAKLMDLPLWAIAAGTAGTIGLPYMAGSAIGSTAARGKNELDEIDLDTYRRAAIARKFRNEAKYLQPREDKDKPKTEVAL